ncbi:cytochrome oxidase small assembly protein [Chitinimonas sp. BJB300]|nr:cytochrome oxidase small assembly protein [Chitinimonas sp. BJB300]
MQNKNLRTGLILASIAVAIGVGFVARLYILGQ